MAKNFEWKKSGFLGEQIERGRKESSRIRLTPFACVSSAELIGKQGYTSTVALG